MQITLLVVKSVVPKIWSKILPNIYRGNQGVIIESNRIREDIRTPICWNKLISVEFDISLSNPQIGPNKIVIKLEILNVKLKKNSKWICEPWVVEFS